MGGRFVGGIWKTEREWEQEPSGHFSRQTSQFRRRITPDGEFPARPGRYHLFVSYACPWAHRTLMVRSLMGLEDAIPVSVVHPVMGDEGWHFAPQDPDFPSPDRLGGRPALKEYYRIADAAVTGRVTVPTLWDTEKNTIVNNESSEIIRDFCTAFAPFATREAHLYPEPLRPAIDEAMERFYEPINNGVYRCGFAGTDEAYREGITVLFNALDEWDAVLAHRTYLTGETLTLADLALFATLLRFDPVYYIHFKTSVRHVYAYSNLWRFVCNLYNHSLIHPTIRMDHIQHHYFRSHPHLNPTRRVPAGPVLDYGGGESPGTHWLD